MAMEKTPFDPKYRRKNPAAVSWWDRYDALSPEARELIMYDTIAPTPEILQVAAELTGIAFPELERNKLNTKQRAWLERRRQKELEAQRRAKIWAERSRSLPTSGFAQMIAPHMIYTKEQIVSINQAKLTREQEEQRRLHKVLGLTKKIKIRQYLNHNG